MSENPRWDYLSAWLDIFHEGWRDYLGLFSHASPPVQNTRASPSCSNSSPRKFMSLRCRSARRSSGVKPTSSNLNSWWGHEEALFFFSPVQQISRRQAASLSAQTHKYTVLLPVHKFNKSDTSDLWKQSNCPLWTVFQQQQGGWSVHVSPLHVSLQWSQCV